MSKYSFTQVKLPPRSEYKCTIFADDLLAQRDELLAAANAVRYADDFREENDALDALYEVIDKVEKTK